MQLSYSLLLAALLPLLPLVTSDGVTIETPAINPLPNGQKPTDLCAVYDEIDADEIGALWYPWYYLHQTMNTQEGLVVEEKLKLDDNRHYHFQAGTFKYDFDYIKLDTRGKKQFKISFLSARDQIIASVWASRGTFCKLPTKLIKSEVYNIVMSERYWG